MQGKFGIKKDQFQQSPIQNQKEILNKKVMVYPLFKIPTIWRLGDILIDEYRAIGYFL